MNEKIIGICLLIIVNWMFSFLLHIWFDNEETGFWCTISTFLPVIFFLLCLLIKGICLIVGG